MKSKNLGVRKGSQNCSLLWGWDGAGDQRLSRKAPVQAWAKPSALLRSCRWNADLEPQPHCARCRQLRLEKAANHGIKFYARFPFLCGPPLLEQKRTSRPRRGRVEV